MLSGAKACNSCRSRQELSNEYLVAKFGFGTAGNEPLKVYQKSGQKLEYKFRQNTGGLRLRYRNEHCRHRVCEAAIARADRSLCAVLKPVRSARLRLS